MTAEPMTTARPPQPSRAADRLVIFLSQGAANATRPPTASSQALVGREKNAQGWETPVSHTPNAKDATASRASAVAASAGEGWDARRMCGERRCQIVDAPSSSNGQTR